LFGVETLQQYRPPRNCLEQYSELCVRFWTVVSNLHPFWIFLTRGRCLASSK